MSKLIIVQNEKHQGLRLSQIEVRRVQSWKNHQHSSLAHVTHWRIQNEHSLTYSKRSTRPCDTLTYSKRNAASLKICFSAAHRHWTTYFASLWRRWEVPTNMLLNYAKATKIDLDKHCKKPQIIFPRSGAEEHTPNCYMHWKTLKVTTSPKHTYNKAHHAIATLVRRHCCKFWS